MKLIFPCFAASLLVSLVSCDVNSSKGPVLHFRENQPEEAKTIEKLPEVQAPKAPEISPLTSVLRINSVTQEFDQFQPWDKKKPRERNGLGAVLPGNFVLTTGEIVANSTYLEFISADGTKTTPAKVVAVDYDCNLALLAPIKPEGAELFKDLIPLQIADDIDRGSELKIWQIESSGMPLVTNGQVLSIGLASTYISDAGFLTYSVKASLQNVSSSYTLPVVKSDKLVGVLSSYNATDQISQVIPGPVIQRFLTDAKDGKYEGFAVFGVFTAETSDPIFREWLKLPENFGGQYVAKLVPGSPAEKSGIKEKDVIIEIDGHAIDSRGFYQHPKYKRLNLSQIIREHRVGDKLTVKVWRDGKVLPFDVVLELPSKQGNLIPNQMIDKAPKYLIYGGIVFQELTIPFLSAFGNDWEKSAPRQLVEIVNQEDEYAKKGYKRLIFISRVIPTPATLGYEGLAGSLLESVNGVPAFDLESVVKALDSHDGIHDIQIKENPKHIYLDSKQSQKVNQLLQNQPGFPKLRRLSEAN